MGGEKIMKIKKILDATKEDIENKKFNIFVGISLGNKYFTKFRIKEYILWALKYTKEDVLVIVADRLHTVNFEVIKGYDKEKAEKAALKVGQDVLNSVQHIINSLPKDKIDLVKVVRWDDITENKDYQESSKIIFEEFEKNKKFRDYILNIVKENLGIHAPKEEDKIEKLANYVLGELPMFMKGIEFGEKHYTLIPYPGLTKIDELVHGLQNNILFKDLAKKLKIKGKKIIVEAYID
ncbi:tRNA-dependent cyclodipeptide synthase [archaeon]|nr:tRNA-dependent cyclodipeptide synthase [archaeon]